MSVASSEGVYLYDILDFCLCEISFCAGHCVESTCFLVGLVIGDLTSNATEGFEPMGRFGLGFSRSQMKKNCDWAEGVGI